MTVIDRRSLLLGIGATAALPGCTAARSKTQATSRATRLIAAARSQVGVTTRYDSAYTVLPFPNGDVARVKGVCTDVIIRAYRAAFGLDLQALVNAHRRAAFAAYRLGFGPERPQWTAHHPQYRPRRARGGRTPRLADYRPLPLEHRLGSARLLSAAGPDPCLDTWKD